MTMTPVGQTDPKQLAEHYSKLARAHFDLHNARGRLDFDGKAAKGEPMPVSAQYHYGAETEVVAALGIAVLTSFDVEGLKFEIHGGGGGIAIGGGSSWGSVWLNYRPDEMPNWEYNFEANLGLGAVNINWWGMHGEYIGSYAGGGVSGGIGAVGGYAKIEQR